MTASSSNNRREALLRRAVRYVAEQLQTGSRLGLAIRIAAGKFRGRSLEGTKRLKLSRRTLEHLWYESDCGRDPSAFRLKYMPGGVKRIEPSIVSLFVEHCQQRRIPIPIALRQLGRLVLAFPSAKTSVQVRKKRIQGKIANLPAVQREQVHKWFRENLEYSEIAARIDHEFGVSIANSNLCKYYSTHNAEIFEVAAPEASK